MKKIIYILLIGIFSCQNPSDNLIEKNKSLIQQNELLKKGNKSVSEMNSKLRKENENLKKIIPFVKFSTRSITSDTLVKTIYKQLVYENKNSTHSKYYQFLYYLSDLINSNKNNFHSDPYIENLIKSPNSHTYLHYIWRNIDRTPENIKYLFDQNKEYAYILLKSGNSYKNSGFEGTIKILLKSHEEISNDEELLKNLNTRSKKIGVLSDTIYRSLESQEMEKLISQFTDSDSVSYTNWVYSFWARRYNENNSEIVYQIIKEFDNEMSKYNEEKIDEEDYYEEIF